MSRGGGLVPVVPRASTEINSRVMRTYEYHRRGTVEIRTIQARLRDVEYIEWQRQGRMNSFFEALRDSRILNRLFRAAGTSMESRLRHRLHDPFKILQDAGVRAGDRVLEVGCGTGFFTVPAARVIGEQGLLVAMDALMASLAFAVAYVLRLQSEYENIAPFSDYWGMMLIHVFTYTGMDLL